MNTSTKMHIDLKIPTGTTAHFQANKLYVTYPGKEPVIWAECETTLVADDTKTEYLIKWIEMPTGGEP